MDPNAKKTALRMVPYGIYVLTAKAPDGTVAAATVNWVTQTAFTPPLVVAGIKTDSGAYATTRKAGAFALNMLGKGQQTVAFTFFKPTAASEGKLSGEPYRNGSTGAPVLLNAAACIECKVVEVIERGDHHIFVGEVVDAHLTKVPEGRPDAAILEMKDLGEKTFYGG